MLCLTEMVEHSIYDLWGRDLELYPGWFGVTEGVFIHYNEMNLWLIRVTLNSNSPQLKKVSGTLFLLLKKCWSFDAVPEYFASSDLNFA